VATRIATFLDKFISVGIPVFIGIKWLVTGVTPKSMYRTGLQERHEPDKFKQA